MQHPLRAVVYVRVSTDDQADFGTGLETQELQCIKMAEQIGATIIAVESDPGISGTLFPRPGIERALRLLETGEADGIVAYNASRLGRRTIITLSIWERIQQAGARLFVTDLGEVTEENELMLTVQGGFAQHEWREIRKRMKAGQRRRAEQGKMPTRIYAPFGYWIVRNGHTGPDGEEAGNYTVIEDQAEIVRELFTRFAAGDSLRGLAHAMQDRGIETPKPAKATNTPQWTASTIKRILNNPAYKGMALWGKTEVRRVNGKRVQSATPAARQVKIPTPAIVDAELWETCQEQLQLKAGNGIRRDRKHVFAGLMVCPNCERRFLSHRTVSYWHRKRDDTRQAYIRVYYQCADYSEGRNAAGVVCHRKQYPEPTVLEAVCRLSTVLASDPTYLQAAVTFHRQRIDRRTDRKQFDAANDALKELDSREKATATAYARAIQIGTRAEVFESLLGEIAAERRTLEQRKASLEATLSDIGDELSEDAAAIVAAYAADLLEVLNSETLTPAEKNGRLSRVVTEIRPVEDGFRIVLKPFRKGSHVVPVAFVPAKRPRQRK